tara:strand:+ start:8319 stop:8534 length:216 start_codon:yes stop_codon:yes gene_type:complete
VGKPEEKTVLEVNRKIRRALPEEVFEDQLRSLLRRGLVEIVSAEEDGTPIVKVTQKGLEKFFQEWSGDMPI